MKVNTSRKSGFTLVEIMIVVAIIGLLAAIAIPNFVRARENSQINACVANLKQIDGAIQTWALEQKKATGGAITYLGGSAATPSVAGHAEAYIRVEPKCPAGNGSYTVNKVGDAKQVECPNYSAADPALSKHVLP
jgi:prepilin-type N-terminal cleavage/methylation domain-containing protein